MDLTATTKRTRAPRDYPVAELLDVHDGDTVRVRVDVGFDADIRKWIRLRGVFAPELYDEGGKAAKQTLITLFNDRAPDGYVQLTTFWTPGESKEINEDTTFMRYVGDVVLLDGTNVNDYMRLYLEID